MLRLAPPGFERFLQTSQFVATFGGGEANVAVALSVFGLPAAYVTALPPSNPISDAVIGELRRFGVDTPSTVQQFRTGTGLSNAPASRCVSAA